MAKLEQVLTNEEKKKIGTYVDCPLDIDIRALTKDWAIYFCGLNL